jgi:hypothetical protein
VSGLTCSASLLGTKAGCCKCTNKGGWWLLLLALSCPRRGMCRPLGRISALARVGRQLILDDFYLYSFSLLACLLAPRCVLLSARCTSLRTARCMSHS